MSYSEDEFGRPILKARLVATAPDLLSWQRKAVELLDEAYNWPSRQREEWYDQVEKLIAEATG